MSARPSDPLALAGQRLQWLEQRQKVLAQNIANANTPGYQPRDLAPFASALERAGTAAALARTDPRHIAARDEPRGQRDRAAAERAPDGNAVSLEQQALKVAETDQAHALALNLYKSWAGLFRSALGRSS
ncbi:flagellar basal body protein [Roseomonas sp. GC11]|uniref:flagellar basal body rod protein FlgB n=1 Tax=Roseomonas sp. GC11 TaxID=2950546 RepID=UPI00210AD27B|nr:flagellar basal body protein [Roseomonas sp. GC11]MCQ4161967.1 flagellar basal body protein [Roseomonas sp. GC11]